MKTISLLAAFIGLSLPSYVAQSPTTTESPTGPRNFYMGFTGFVYDYTPAAVEATHKFVRENGDILCHHIEGVPWAEALKDEPFPAALFQEWKDKKSAARPGMKIYLAISPGRGDLKPADKGGPVPPELTGKSYDDPLVLKAYLNYCRRAIEFFGPDYLAIGIETNEIYSSGADKWRAYVTLHQYIYRELKKERPILPIFASWTLHNMVKQRGKMLDEWHKLMPYNDMIAVSYYPFFVEDKNRLAALDWITEQFDSYKKPYAIVETNDAAERLELTSYKVVIDGSPEKQVNYYRHLLNIAQQHKFEFVISFVHQDYDALWEKIEKISPELFKAWRDCGLLDQDGQTRPAFWIWKSYYKLPRK